MRKPIKKKAARHCTINEIDDGELDYLIESGKIAAHPKLKPSLAVTSFKRDGIKITIQFRDYHGCDSELTVVKADFLNWAETKGHLVLLPSIEYLDNNHLDRQPSDINTILNSKELERFYKYITKDLLQEYLTYKIQKV